MGGARYSCSTKERGTPKSIAFMVHYSKNQLDEKQSYDFNFNLFNLFQIINFKFQFES